MRVVDFIAKYLDSVGVSYAFGVGGANIEDLYDAIYRLNGNLKAIVGKHEFTATAMACGYSLVTNKFGVVMATSGGGAFNAIAALGEAYASKIPIVALLGQPYSHLEGKGVFQDTSGLKNTINASKLFGCVTTKFIKKPLQANEVPRLLQQAIKTACSEPLGPAILMLSKDLQQAEITETPDYSIPKITKAKLVKKDQEKILDLLDKIRNTKKPLNFLFIAGPEIIQASCQKMLVNLAEKFNASVAVTFDAKSAFDNRHHRFIGVTGASHKTVHDASKGADVIVILGANMSMTTVSDIKDSLHKKIIVYIASELPSDEAMLLGRDNDTTIIKADVGDSLGFILKRLNNFSSSVSHIERKHVAYLPPLSFNSLSEFNFASILEVFAKYIEADADIFADAGNTGAAVAHYLPSTPQGHFGIAMGLGGMGFAVGAGIGAAFAEENKKVYIFVGDGSFLMHGLELHTAIEHELPVVFVIFNNNSHAMCYTREKLFFKGDYTYNLFKPAYYGKGLAAMFPSLALSEDINDLSELEKCLQKAKDITTPVVLSLNLDAEELPPFYLLLQVYLKQRGKA